MERIPIKLCSTVQISLWILHIFALPRANTIMSWNVVECDCIHMCDKDIE